jgi:dihydroneopterin aldolase
MDSIRVELDAVACVVGILPDERTREQPVRVAATLWLDLETCARTGKLEASVEYAAVAAGIEKLLKDGKFELLETAAHKIIYALLAASDRVRRVEVALTKLQALGGTARATVTMSRGRG